MTIKCNVYPQDPVDKIQVENFIQILNRVYGEPLPEGAEFYRGSVLLPSGMSPTAYRRLFRELWEKSPKGAKLAFYVVFLNSGFDYMGGIFQSLREILPDSQPVCSACEMWDAMATRFDELKPLMATDASKARTKTTGKGEECNSQSSLPAE